MKKILLFTFLVSIISCNSNNINVPDVKDSKSDLPRFKIVIDTIDAPENINDINFYKDKILLKGENVTWLMNHDFSIDSSKTSRYNQKKFDYIVNYRDTLIAPLIRGNKPYYYYLDDKFNWHSVKIKDNNAQKLIWKEPYFLNDSIYDIYSCCNGEFGGMLYFKNKKTGRTTATMITCVNEIFRYNNVYYVSKFLAHMGASSSLIVISDPEKLQEVSSDTLICSYWLERLQSIDSWDSVTRAFSTGLDFIIGPTYDSTLISTFVFNNYLIGLLHLDTAKKTYLSFINDGLLTIYDSLTNSPFTNRGKRMYTMEGALWFDNSYYYSSCIGKLSNDTFYFYYLRSELNR